MFKKFVNEFRVLFRGPSGFYLWSFTFNDYVRQSYILSYTTLAKKTYSVLIFCIFHPQSHGEPGGSGLHSRTCRVCGEACCRAYVARRAGQEAGNFDFISSFLPVFFLWSVKYVTLALMSIVLENIIMCAV